jgi:hypothetical protein
MYREWAQYPSHSRPLKESAVDLNEPHWVPKDFQPVTTHTADGKLESAPYACRLQPLTSRFTEGQTAQLATLACIHEIGLDISSSADRRELPLAIESVAITALAEADSARRVDSNQTSFNDAGTDGDAQAGDNITTVIFRPSPEDHAHFLITARFSVQDDPKRTVYELVATFAAAPRAPAAFTGVFGEFIHQGSLHVWAELEVREPGIYRVMGNLRQGDAPVAYSKQQLPLLPGKHSVALQFFGKIFHDQNRSGKFRLTDLRGERLAILEPGAPPDAARPVRQPEPIKPWSAPYETREIGLTELSAAEFTSPEKSAHLRELETALRF